MRQALIDEFSYASEAHSLGRILAIRAVETMSGQPFLKKLYLDYQRENLPPESFWGEVINRLDLDVKIHAGTLQNVPATGPLVVVANHPYSSFMKIDKNFILIWYPIHACSSKSF